MILMSLKKVTLRKVINIKKIFSVNLNMTRNKKVLA